LLQVDHLCGINTELMIKVAIAEDISKLSAVLKEKIELAVEFKVVSISCNRYEILQSEFRK